MTKIARADHGEERARQKTGHPGRQRHQPPPRFVRREFTGRARMTARPRSVKLNYVSRSCRRRGQHGKIIKLNDEIVMMRRRTSLAAGLQRIAFRSRRLTECQME